MKSFLSQINCLGGACARQARTLFVLAIIALLVFWPLLNIAKAAAGDLDASFGIGGKVTTDFLGFADIATDVAIQADGRIVVAGAANTIIRGNDFAIARYNPDGSLDLSFGSGGKVLTDFFGLSDAVLAIAIQPDSKIVAAGSSDLPSGTTDIAIVRYNPDGSLDPSFGSGGKVTTDFFNTSDSASGVIIQPDGKIVIAGDNLHPNTFISDFVLVRYNPDGSLDPGFGSGGKVTTDFSQQFGGGINFDRAFDLVLQSDGKLVAAGQAFTSMGADFALARYNNNGTLDLSFGSGGKMVTDFAGGQDLASSMALQSDGKILLAGETFAAAGTKFALARYNTDGSLDSSFGSNGRVVAGDGLISANAIALQRDGKILVVGHATSTTVFSDFGLARFNTNGSLDTTFGSGGKVTTDFFGGNDEAFSVVIQADDKILVAGSAGIADFGLARYDAGIVGPIFNICVQDDSNGNLLEFNSATGDYQFTNCRKGFTLTGRGTVRIRFCKIELIDDRPDRSLNVLANSCTHVGSAQVVSQGKTFTISDMDTTNNTCACR